MNPTEKALFWGGGVCWECAQEQNEDEVVGEDRASSCACDVMCMPQFICYIHFVSAHKLKYEKRDKKGK